MPAERPVVVRARHGAVAVPGARAPWDRVHYRLFHPARRTDSPEERQTGQLPPDATSAPWPVVILLNGINVGAEGYRWLAEHLGSAGLATLTFSHVGEITPGAPGLSPGLDLGALSPEEFGTRPSSTTVGPIIDALAAERRTGPLAGLLDLERLALGGHSAGGTVALLNADRRWFPEIRASFAYAGHTMPAAMLGHPEGTVLPLPSDVPALIMGGTRDGVVAASAARYRSDDADAHDPVARTFLEGARTPGSALAVLEGAGHLSFCDPVDTSTARGFLEAPPDLYEPARRQLIGQLVAAFLGEHLDVDTSGPTMDELAGDPRMAQLRLHEGVR